MTRRLALLTALLALLPAAAGEDATGVVLVSEHELELPPHSYVTQAAWWQLPKAWREEFARMGHDFAGSIHALEHCQIAMLRKCERFGLG